MSLEKNSDGVAVLNKDVAALNKYKLERSYYRKIDQLHTDLLDIKRSIISISERIERLESK